MLHPQTRAMSPLLQPVTNLQLCSYKRWSYRPGDRQRRPAKYLSIKITTLNNARAASETARELYAFV